MRFYMGNGRKDKRAEMVLEYAILIVVVCAALIVMSLYATRVFCGQWRGSADAWGMGYQYEPGVTTVTVTLEDGTVKNM